MVAHNLITAAVLMIVFPAGAKQKNVLFIAVDDLKPLLSCYGEEGVYSPNIDRLAEKGTVFMNCHCQQAVCSPSRASLMFGIRPDKTRIWDLKTPVRSFTQKQKTIPQHFRDNGYETAAFGKIFHISMTDREHDSLSWSIPYSRINVENYPENYGTPVGGHFQNPDLKGKMNEYLKNQLKKGISQGQARADMLEKMKVSTEKLDVPDEAYQDGQISQNAVQMIRKLSKSDKPFFIAVGFKKPHLPFVAPKKYWDLYERSNIKLSEWTSPPSGSPDFAMHDWNELKSYSDIDSYLLPSGLLDADKQRELIHGYLACVSFTDAQIGKLLDELEKQNIADETIVVLWGDHGWHLGDHGLWCKHSNFEQATRAPLIFSSPGGQQGLINNSPVEFVDIYPTLCDLAGIQIPDNLDGMSLKPVLNGKKPAIKEYALSQYPRGNKMGYSLRTERYRYTAWFEIDYRNGERPDVTNRVAEELYDYKIDAHETKNLDKEKDYSVICHSLAQKLLNSLK